MKVYLLYNLLILSNRNIIQENKVASIFYYIGFSYLIISVNINAEAEDYIKGKRMITFNMKNESSNKAG